MSTSAKPAPFLSNQIACYPIVRKFLARNYSIPFMVAARENAFSNYLAACLDRNPSHRLFVSLDELTDRLPIKISTWRHKSGFSKVLTPQAILDFNRFVVDTFMDRIMIQLVLAQINGQSVMKSGQMVIDRYGLTNEELSLDAMMTYYFIHREQYLYLGSGQDRKTGRGQKGIPS